MNLEIMKQKYLESIKISLAKGTYKCYNSNLITIFKFFMNNQIFESDEITNSVLTDFVIFSHKRNNTNRSINLRIQILKNMFRYNNVENSSVLNFKKLKEDRNTFGFLSIVELNRLFDYLENSKVKLKNRMLILLLIDTGVRINEALNIKVKNINFSNHTIYLEKTKNRKFRYVPFTEKLSQLLMYYILEIGEREYLFDLTYDGVKSCFSRIGQKLGFNKFHPHMLRHSLASLLHRNGASLMIIQKILGHSSVAITERYIHFDMDQVLNVYEKTMHF